MLAPAQALLHLQTRVIDPAVETSEIQAPIRSAAGVQRYLIQWQEAPYDAQMKLLQERGGRVIGSVPVDGFVVAVPSGFDWEGFALRYRAPVSPADKIGLSLRQTEGDVKSDDEAKAGALGATAARWYLVLFHADVEPLDARRIAMDPNIAVNPGEAPLELREHPSLLAHHLLVSGPAEQVQALANWDEVALILPASDDLTQGAPVVACEGSVLNGFPLSPLAGAATTGGWPRNAQDVAEIGVHFGNLTQKLSAAAALGEIRRALAEWARVARLRFQEGAATTAPRTLAFAFATGDHGDPFPFTGARGVIAHAFFPSPPNPEPWAGDVHFNDDMAFRIGADIDLFSVALHEIGHALGLPHTDAPGAVMYPYYRMSSALSATDIANIRQLYAAATGSTPTGAAPALTLNLNPPPARATTPTLILEGTVSNAAGAARVDWINDRGGSGTAPVAPAGTWRASAIPLETGNNEIRLTAVDAAQARAERIVTVQRVTSTTGVSAPSITATEPTLLRTRELSVRVRGNASHSSGIRRVAWVNAAGGAGEAALSGNTWTVDALPLRPGSNALTFTATSTDGATASTALTIVCEATADNTPPQVVIQTPSGTSVLTTLEQITITGTASDASGIAEITWTNSAGPNGTATAVTPTFAQWRAQVKLVPGFNTITIRAKDSAGNVGWRTLSVTRR